MPGFELADGTVVRVDPPDIPVIQVEAPTSEWRVVPVPGPPGPAGPAGTSVTGYTHTQASPSATWPITHNLGRYPTVVIRLTSGERVLPDVTDSSLNTLTLTYATPQTGTAQLI